MCQIPEMCPVNETFPRLEMCPINETFQFDEMVSRLEPVPNVETSESIEMYRSHINELFASHISEIASSLESLVAISSRVARIEMEPTHDMFRANMTYPILGVPIRCTTFSEYLAVLSLLDCALLMCMYKWQPLADDQKSDSSFRVIMAIWMVIILTCLNFWLWWCHPSCDFHWMLFSHCIALGQLWAFLVFLWVLLEV